MAKNMSDSVQQALAALPRKEKEYRQFMRALPLDLNAMEQWTKKGEAMVAELLASDKPIEDKEIAEWQLFGRDYQKASKYFWFVRDFAKTTETDYWDVVAAQYWESLRLRLDAHITKYADLPAIADRAKDFLSGLKARAPRLADRYWEELYQEHGHSEKEGIKALYKVAAENVAAIEALKTVDFTEKPLEMAFTAMDGKTVDISKMRGKVVLIDFWATYCAPCIKEMPHVRALYDKYRDQGFEVIGIAADGDEAKSRVLDVLNMTKANWPQRLDKGPDASVSFIALYNITSFPTVWLLNKDGVVVDRNARGERLEPLIREHLGLE
jgi:thiol-disulfide isomerase/thioredoxin